jgi:hypothetical protein
MSLTRINQLPSGAAVTDDDIFLFMDDPSGVAVTKRVSASVLRSSILSEPANLQINRGTSSEVSTYTPLQGEPVFATDTKILNIGDGSTLGGIPVNNTYVKIVSSSPVASCVDDNNNGTCYYLIDPDLQFTLTPQGSVWGVETNLYFYNTDLEAGSANGVPSILFASISGIKYISALATSSTIASGNITVNTRYKDLTVDNTAINFTKYYIPHPQTATIYQAKCTYLLSATSGTPVFGPRWQSSDPTDNDNATVRVSGTLIARRII